MNEGTGKSKVKEAFLLLRGLESIPAGKLLLNQDVDAMALTFTFRNGLPSNHGYSALASVVSFKKKPNKAERVTTRRPLHPGFVCHISAPSFNYFLVEIWRILGEKKEKTCIC